MNIVIITVYNSENCGSFLQAYALYSYLKEKGHDIVFYNRKTNGTSHSRIRLITDVTKLLCKFRFNLSECRIRSYKAFSKAHGMLPIVSSFEHADTIIIGSDTMWNFDDKYFSKMKSLYSGFDIKDKNTITYAVSIANTCETTLEKDDLIIDGIRNLNSISVRDDATAEVVYRITKHMPYKVLDPTLLIDSDSYHDIEATIPSGNYLLLYCFDTIDNEKKNAVKNFALKMNLSIVSFGSFLGWEDIYEPLDPLRFLAYFREARFVITDTFHGNVFSIIYKKNFVSWGSYKKKVKSLLDSVGLSNRICSDGATIERIMSKEPCYDDVYSILEHMRLDSKLYLMNNLGE